MPNLLAAAAVTFVLSLALASVLLWWRCRRKGRPFAPHARPWALLIVVATAIASAGAGLLLAAVSHRTSAAYAGLVVAAGLVFARVPPRGDLDLRPRSALASLPTLPFSRLYDLMGDDKQEWCAIRIAAARPNPQWIADAALYYWGQVRGRLKGDWKLAQLSRWRESITHKVGIIRLIDLDTSPELVLQALQTQASTQNRRKYTEEDLQRLARRLESDALNELSLFLSYTYSLRVYNLPVYPSRPPDPRKTRHAIRVLSAQ